MPPPLSSSTESDSVIRDSVDAEVGDDEVSEEQHVPGIQALEEQAGALSISHDHKLLQISPLEAEGAYLIADRSASMQDAPMWHVEEAAICQLVIDLFPVICRGRRASIWATSPDANGRNVTLLCSFGDKAALPQALVVLSSNRVFLLSKLHLRFHYIVPV